VIKYYALETMILRYWPISPAIARQGREHLFCEM